MLHLLKQLNHVDHVILLFYYYLYFIAKYFESLYVYNAKVLFFVVNIKSESRSPSFYLIATPKHLFLWVLSLFFIFVLLSSINISIYYVISLYFKKLFLYSGTCFVMKYYFNFCLLCACDFTILTY